MKAKTFALEEVGFQHKFTWPLFWVLNDSECKPVKDTVAYLQFNLSHCSLSILLYKYVLRLLLKYVLLVRKK